MDVLEKQISETLLPGMFIPEPLKLLFRWIEARGSYYENPETSQRHGFLGRDEQPVSEWPQEWWGGTNIQFYAEGNVHLKYWLGHEKSEVLNRLCVFAKTGYDGSMAAFWLAPNGEQKIVHLGSGPGSTLVCVLADDPVDFLRLLAIGYHEICWDVTFSLTIEAAAERYETDALPDLEFRRWVEETFAVEIPQTALEIIKHPSQIGDSDSNDEFFLWLKNYY